MSERKSRNLRAYRRLITVTIVGLFLIGIAYWATRYVASPTSGIVQQGTVTAAQTPKPTWRTINTGYISYQVPSDYRTTPSDSFSAPILAATTYREYQAQPLRVTILVKSLPSGQLADDGDYNYRQSNPGLFTTTSLAVNNQDIPVFISTTDTSALTAFLVHGQLAVTVSMQGGSPEQADETVAEYNRIVGSVQWLKAQ